MTVIAVAMEIGTYDKRFGSCLAEDMGLELFDMRRLERDVAERNNASDGSIHQFIKHRIFGAKCSSLSYQQLSASIKEEIVANAVGRNVLILGWSAAALLRSLRHVVRVRIFAPVPWRERNVMKECTYGDVRTAQLEIESADAHIAGLVKRLTDADWLDASLYHLTVNAEGTPGEACAKLIGGLANSSQFRDTATSRDELTNMLLGARQRNWHSELGGPRGSTVTVVDGHEVPLTCDDSHENAIAKIERHLHGEWTSYGARDRRRTLR